MHMFTRHLTRDLDVPVPDQPGVVHRVMIVVEARLVVALDREAEARDLRLTNSQLVDFANRAWREASASVWGEQNGARVMAVHGATARVLVVNPNFGLSMPGIGVRVDHANVVPSWVSAMGEGLSQVYRLKITRLMNWRNF
jgi:hypothetical protein